MRKQYKRKRRSCGLCKPHKRGLEKRWKLKDLPRKEDRVYDRLTAFSHSSCVGVYHVLALDNSRRDG